MRYFSTLLLLVITVFVTSCRNDFEFEQNTGGLEFSRDIVYLDTVFTNIGSSTYTLKVYNKSNKDIKIPSIKLGEGEESKYRLMVDGLSGKIFNDVELLAKDSLFVFIETTIDYNEYANSETTFLYTDNIQFSSINGVQKVELITLVQDAIFIKPDRSLSTGIKETLTINGMSSDMEGHELNTEEELHWTNNKPYVIYGYALVPNGKKLTVDAGARVHFHAESGLIIDNTATLEINGSLSATELLENEVIFEGDRLEHDFSEIPGQWGSILLMSGSDNKINYLTLKNATVGLLIQRTDENTTPKLEINNSQIYNSSNFGILARTANITGSNLVINKAGQASLACTLGGNYQFKHCTFANYFNRTNQVPVLLNDYMETQDAIYISDMNAVFDNCIIYGSSNYGISLQNEGGTDTTFSTKFNYCLIKFHDFSGQWETNPLYQFGGENYTGSIITGSSATNPNFIDPIRNNLAIKEPSVAIAKANSTVASQVPTDIKGKDRTQAPDIGAYQHTTE